MTDLTLDDYIKWMDMGGKVSAGMSAVGAGLKIASGFAGLDAARYQSAQLRQNAGNAQAAGERQAYDLDQQTKMIQSRALAVAAASGGGASDPGVVNIMARTAAEGAYRKAMALYNGDERAQAMMAAADAKDYEGKVEKQNAITSGLLQTVQAGTSLLTSKARAKGLARYGAGVTPDGNLSWTPSANGMDW